MLYIAAETIYGQIQQLFAIDSLLRILDNILSNNVLYYRKPIIIYCIKHQIYCNEEKTKCLLKATWLVNMVIILTMCLLHAFTDIDVSNLTITIYISLGVDVSFLLIAFLTYAYVFYPFKQTRLPPTRNRANKQNIF